MRVNQPTILRVGENNEGLKPPTSFCCSSMLSAKICQAGLMTQLEVRQVVHVNTPESEIDIAFVQDRVRKVRAPKCCAAFMVGHKIQIAI